MTKSSIKSRPLFVVENETERELLRKVANPVSFPLSEEDRNIIETLTYMVGEELDLCSGLAAPQIGVSKRIIVFQVPKGVLKFRRDVESLLPLTALINPTYTPHPEDGKSLDWEGCYSIKSQMGKVWRFKTVTYTGQTECGTPFQGIARGFLARLIQHEIDHLDGKLASDMYDLNAPHGPMEEMRKIRLKEVEDLQNQEL